MIISKVTDEDGGKGEGYHLTVDNNAQEYQTASELFDFMAKNQNYNINDGDRLTARDLILLYKNIDLRTKLVDNDNQFRCQRSNQHVETVIYNDDQDSDGSDMSDIYSNEDLHNVFQINKERLDLFNNQSSVENTLCHKFGDLEIQSSISGEYDKHYLFNDPFIKEQLKSFNLMSTSHQIDGTILPASLLDYVYCRNFEDNYTFYMDNIIRYVKNTIEHLKRISNGDYLTEKVKEKWREAENIDHASSNDTKILATSTSIPLHVECKIDGRLTNWDDMVHSAVDIRSLSKNLERKIVIDIPKVINGSYKLLSKCCRDHLIISCKKDTEAVEEAKESRVNVMFQLKRSEIGQVMSDINSIMILQTVPSVQNEPLPITYNVKKTNYFNNIEENAVIITELNTTKNYESYDPKTSSDKLDLGESDFDSNKSDSLNEDNYYETFKNCQDNLIEYNYPSNSKDEGNQIKNRKAFDVCPDYLQMTMHSMSLQSVLPEETVEDVPQLMPPRKKSPIVRIKSPYENKSFAIEERKRRKLLEIRERRERKKVALAENCKINKHKYGKVAVMPQPSNSVTKLSITNKSFYNSIYGHHLESKQLKIRNRNIGGGKSEIIEVPLENLGSEHDKLALTPEKDTKKFINRSYYLDDTVTEMMLSNMKQDDNEDDIDKETCSLSNSSDYRINLNILSQLLGTSDSEPNIDNEQHAGAVHHEKTSDEMFKNLPDSESNQENSTKELVASQSLLNVVPSNKPKIISDNKEEDKESKKVTPSIECRRSIDKIYQLMENLGNSKSSDEGIKINASSIIDAAAGRGNSSIQASDSGTSLKHHLTSSNPSTFSFDKNNNSECQPNYDKPVDNVTNVIPKVIISSKTEEPKIASEKFKRERKRTVGSPPKIQENPLKAISQILHEFENVQKNRIKSGREQKLVKKADTTSMNNEGKPVSRPGRHKRQLEPHTDSMNRYNKPPVTTITKDRNPRLPMSGTDAARNINRQTTVNDRSADKNKKKISDIIDEAKEARGEAVRGPSKFTSRLNSLAQPKRIYVQAHSEDYQTRYGRNLITDRLQRLAASPAQPHINKVTMPVNTRNKPKQINNETVPMKFQPGFPIERQPARSRYPYSSISSLDRNKKLHTGLGPLNKPGSIAETPVVKKKMVAFEEYVQSQFRPTSFSTIPGELDYVHKTRTPLLPSDIDIGSVTSSSLSAKESTEIGTRLHHIINSIVKSPSSTLEVLNECFETNSKTVEEHSIPKCYEDISMDFDYITAATDESAFANNDNSENSTKQNQVNQETDCAICDIRLSQSVRAIEKDEHSQSHLLPVGVFGNRLKGNTLSRQSSLYFLQSSDVGSIMVKASISQNFKSDSFLDFQIIPSSHKPGLKFSFTNIPMQITTVGYAFPEYKGLALPENYGSPSLCNLLEDVSNPSNDICPLEKAHEQCGTEREYSHQEVAQNLMPLNEINQVVMTHFSAATKEQNGQENEQIPVKDKSQQVIPENVKKDEGCNRIVKLQQTEEVSAQSPDNIDFSTSLDILVGLLNEIKNMTCQSQLTDNEHEDSKELQTILNKTFMENSIQSSLFDELSINALSLTSLEKLRSLESDLSVYSYHLSDNHSIGCYNDIVPDIRPWYDTKNAYYKPIYADKEVSVDLANKECVTTPTEVPSICFPVKINRSTKVSNSFIGGYRPLSSSQSMFSFVDFHSTNSYNTRSTNLGNATNDLSELKNIPNEKELNLILVCNKTKPKTKPKTERTNKIKIIKQNKISEYNVKNKDNTLCIKSPDFDPAMKLKRDILVTVYSMLVVTVFAALSFPEVLYHL